MTDLRYAARQLLKNPGFTTVAIFTLALGIGSATAIFSVVDAVLLRPLPFPQQERIVELHEVDENGDTMSFAEPNFDDLRARSRSFEALAKFNFDTQGVVGGSEPVQTDVAAVSEDFFRVLHITPFKGRLLASESGTDVAVVSYGFWHRFLGGRASLEDTTIRCFGHIFSVIGVLPSGEAFPLSVDLWFPRSVYPSSPSRTGHNFRVIGRLRDDVSPKRVAAEIAAIGQQLKQQYGPATDAASFGLAPLRERLVKDVRGMLLLLCGAVGLLLLIACSNVANLLMVRAAARSKEIAVRAALGASRWRLARQFLTETILLTLCAAALGVFFAFWAVDAVVALYHGDLPHVGQISVNSVALVFSLAVAVIVGVVLGFVPALSALPSHLHDQLQAGGRGVSSGHAVSRIRNVLVVSQVALTLMLLVAAGLLGRSFQRLLNVNPGFQKQSAVAMTMSQPWTMKPEELRHVADAYRQLLAQLQSLPGVLAVGGISDLPLSGTGVAGAFLIDDGPRPPANMQELEERYYAFKGTPRMRYANFRVTSVGYFAAMKIPLLRGRLFQESDGPDAPHVALINETLARRTWPNENPIGKQLQFGGMDGDLHELDVVGVVADVRDEALDTNPAPTVYVNYIQRPTHAAYFTIVLRAQGDRGTLIAAMRRAAMSTHPDVPLKFQTLQEVVGASLDNRRFSMVMIGVFAGAALVLAMVGLYGVLSYICSQRTTEIGIRMALGAQRADMLRLILHQSLVLVSAGIVAGVLAAAAATQLLRASLYGVGAADFFTYGAVIVLLALAALAASYFPARRAMNVDPMVALRDE